MNVDAFNLALLNYPTLATKSITNKAQKSIINNLLNGTFLRLHKQQNDELEKSNVFMYRAFDTALSHKLIDNVLQKQKVPEQSLQKAQLKVAEVGVPLTNHHQQSLHYEKIVLEVVSKHPILISGFLTHCAHCTVF